MSMQFHILQQTADWVAIDKPEGMHVHAPETPQRVPIPRSKIILQQLRDQLGQRVYPIHRLDAATSGVLIFALSSDSARELNQKLLQRNVQKKYWAIVRGWMSPEEGIIDRPLESDSSAEMLECKTRYKTLAQIEAPWSVKGRHVTSRYSWLKVSPETGRYRQIRRHMNRIAHPLIGDGDHGDSHHNRAFRENFGVSGLCLRCIEMGWDDVVIRAADIAGVTEATSFGSSEELQLPAVAKWKKLESIFHLSSFSSSPRSSSSFKSMYPPTN